MTKKLDELIENFDVISNGAENKADEEVGKTLTAVTRMSRDEVRELFPTQKERIKLAALMQIVKSSDDRNRKVNAIVRRAEDFSGIILKLLERFV